MSCKRPHRRQFLKAAAGGIGIWVAAGTSPAHSQPPSQRVRFASIGIGGKGASDSNDAGNSGEMVAVCDVDVGRLDGAGKRFPKAKKYTDFRKMLEEMEREIDAVTVSTPDHCHAPTAALSMKMGKAAFVQQPLTRTLCEARMLGELARKMKVATQMGNQGTAADSLRRAAAMLRAGVVGTVKEVHVWTNRPIWPQGLDRPKPEPVPANLKWDLWIGPAPFRPYGKGYHSFAWRGWWDFGTGALGDMACHTVNMPYMGLDLKNPTSVQATTSGHNRDSYPNKSVIKFEFPANANRPALLFFWYDGGNKPATDLFDADLLSSEGGASKKGKGTSAKSSAKSKKGGGRAVSGSGCLVIGDKGKMYAPGDYCENPIRLSNRLETPKVEFPHSPGHFEEWVWAIKGGPQATSNFPDYAGGLTEVILLGNLAVWAAPEADKAGKKIEWDAVNLKATNAPEVAGVIKATYREGYSL
jgi:predicted dehydrogenase